VTAVHLLDRDNGVAREPDATARARSARLRWGVGLAATGAATVLAVVDPAQQRVAPPCVFHALTGLECPGCGSTRAVHELLTGHPLAALDLNPLFVLSLPLLLWGLGAWLVGRPTPLARFRPWPMRTWWWVAGMVVVVAVYGVLRNFDLSPLTYLAASP